jgi:hypothetical protein
MSLLIMRGEALRRQVVLLRRVRHAGYSSLPYTPFAHRRWIHNGPSTRRPRLWFKKLSMQLIANFYKSETRTIYRRHLWGHQSLMARWPVVLRRNAHLRW